MDLEAWAACEIQKPYVFADFHGMTDEQKMVGPTQGLEEWNCTSGDNPAIPWWSYKFQSKMDSALTTRHKPAYLIDGYFSDPDMYDERYADRHTVWFVGTHDGEGVTHPAREHCADLIQGDSHLSVTVAAYQHTWKHFLEKGITHNHDLFLLPNVRHSHHDAISHDYVRACLVSKDCWAPATIHKGCNDWDGKEREPIWDDAKQMYVCSDGDTDCSQWDADGECDDSGIHRYCFAPQQPMFLYDQWRCAWKDMDW